MKQDDDPYIRDSAPISNSNLGDDLYDTYPQDGVNPQTVTSPQSLATVTSVTCSADTRSDDEGVEYVSTNYYDMPSYIAAAHKKNQTNSRTPNGYNPVKDKVSTHMKGIVVNQSSHRVFNGKQSFVFTAHERDIRTEHVQCVILRCLHIHLSSQ